MLDETVEEATHRVAHCEISMVDHLQWCLADEMVKWLFLQNYDLFGHM